MEKIKTLPNKGSMRTEREGVKNIVLGNFPKAKTHFGVFEKPGYLGKFS